MNEEPSTCPTNTPNCKPADYAATGETQHTLVDWQNESDNALNVKIEIKSDSVVVAEPDTAERWGRSVWVELEDNVLRVHCYDGEHEEPLNIDIYEHKIRTWRDRDNE